MYKRQDKELGHTVTVKFDGNFKNAVLWSQCPLGFVCMEPWNGFPGSLTTPEHETLAPDVYKRQPPWSRSCGKWARSCFPHRTP